MNGIVIGAIGVTVLTVALLITLLLRKRRADRTPDRDELLRRARAAGGQISRDNKGLHRGSLRGGGLGSGSQSSGGDGSP
jgi:hypothetical protein